MYGFPDDFFFSLGVFQPTTNSSVSMLIRDNLSMQGGGAKYVQRCFNKKTNVYSGQKHDFLPTYFVKK